MRGWMSLALSGLMAFGVYAQEVDLGATVVADDFEDAFGGDPHQGNLGEVKGTIETGNTWEGGGYWYVFQSAGSGVTNSAGEAVTIVADNARTLVIEELGGNKCLNANMALVEGPPNTYVGIGMSLVGGTPVEYIDLSNLTSISLKVKGTGSVRLRVETRDVASAYDWGYYGASITLSSTWQTVSFTPAQLVPPQYSTPAENSWTFDNGKSAVSKISFQIKEEMSDIELFVDDITLNGITYGDLGFEPSSIRNAVLSSTGNTPFVIQGNTLHFTLPAPQRVSLEVFGPDGALVRTLVDGVVGSGRIDFDKSLRRNAAGRYVYRFTRGENTWSGYYNLVK